MSALPSLTLTPPSPAPSEPWGLDALAGRFVELCGSAGEATLTAAARLLLQAQQRGEPAAWVGNQESVFFPPDFAAAGIDLSALPVVRSNDGRSLARAADTLLRCGAFALIVLDLGRRMRLSMAMQARLAGLAKAHHCVLLAVTGKAVTGKRGPQSSLGPLVSLRGETTVRNHSFGRFTSELHIVKDKRQGPGWRHQEICRGPDGLC